MAWRRWLEIHSYRSPVLFLAMGVCAVIFAWNSVNLATLAMANFRFLKDAGWFAVMEGGLWQLGEISISAVLSLASYFGFKACEHELIDRWLAWRAEK